MTGTGMGDGGAEGEQNPDEQTQEYELIQDAEGQ